MHSRDVMAAFRELPREPDLDPTLTTPFAQCKYKLELHTARDVTLHRLDALLQGAAGLSLQEKYSKTLSSSEQHISEGLS